jgi:Ca-activated chloride channel family protein
MKKYILLLTAILAAQNALATTYGKVRSGNSLYKKSEYDRSLGKYREAQISSPENPVVHFNIGDALHKTGSYDESNAEFNKALGSKDRLLRSKAYYNLGNNAAAQEKTDEAISYYKKCLELNPRDMDAKYNIEYLLTAKSQPKSKDKKDQGKNGGKDKKQQQGAGGGQGKENKESKEKQKNSMSKVDAQRILQYYNDQEKRAADKRKMKNPDLPKTDEDW